MARSSNQPSQAPPLEAEQPALELRDVVKTYGEVRAVAGVSVQLAQGEFLTLLGPSGCGKTTLMNMVAGFFPPTAGEILIAGRNVTRVMAYRRNIGMVFQNYALFPHMTVAQNVAFGLEERRVERSEIKRRVGEALEMVKLSGFDHRLPAHLSGGQQQRVALARALVIRPQVLLLDEPLSALDKNLRTQMQIEIKQIQKQANVAALFVTHDQNEALSLSDRVAVMSHGSIEQIGTPQEVYCAPRSSFVASFVGEINRIAGAVVGETPAGTIVEIAESRRLLVCGQPAGRFAPGMRVALFIRPENIDILGVDSGEQQNVLPGRVRAYSYQGSYTHVVTEVPGLEPIMVTAPGGAVLERHRVDDLVHLRLNLAGAALLAA